MSASNPFEDEMEKPASADFFSGGAPSCRFNQIGDTHRVTILEFEEAQQRNITTGEPKFWPDGNPAKMLVITLQTTERSEDVENDDGTRKLYCNRPGGMFAAIKTALGANKFQVGGTLAVKYVKNGKPTQKGFNAPKEYVAHYAPPGARNGEYPKTRETIASQPRATAAVLDGPGPEDDAIPF
jgi:hypothetical protein